MAKRSKPERPPVWVHEWRRATDRKQLTSILAGMRRFPFTGITARKCSLFEIACAERVSHLFADGIGDQAVEFATRAVEDTSLWQTDEHTRLVAEARGGLDELRAVVWASGAGSPAQVLRFAECTCAWFVLQPTPTASSMLGGGTDYLLRTTGAALAEAEGRAQVGLIHDIFGAPYQPVRPRPEWRTETAVLLARRMYESRDFVAMPILADALQDAGCERAEVLDHCRDPHAVHVRGCWVVDLVLGRA